MANVAKIDIQGVQWELKDQNARDKISVLETKLEGYKSIRHDIQQTPPRQPTCLWDCVLNQISSIDWSFISEGFWTYGVFEVRGICLGTYEAIRHIGGWLEVKGTLTYNGSTHIFSAFYNVQTSLWDYQVDGESFMYLQNNILITQTVDRQYNNSTVPTQIFVRNIKPTTIGNLYEALRVTELLNRVSQGILVWDLQREHNGVDLPKANQGLPIFATSEEINLSGRVFLQNINIGIKNSESMIWWCTWSDGNLFNGVNMYGEPDTGAVPTVALTFTV